MKEYLTEARNKLDNFNHYWQLIFISSDTYKQLKANGFKLVQKDSFFFIDTLTADAKAIAHKFDQSSIIRLDVAYNLTRAERDKMRALGARFSRKYNIDDDFYFITSDLQNRLEQFEQFSSEHRSDRAKKDEALEAVINDLQAVGYALDIDTLQLFFGTDLRKYELSVLTTFLYLLAQTKGKFYSKNGYINLSNRQIADAISYDQHTVSQAISVLARSENLGGVGIISTSMHNSSNVGNRERHIKIDTVILQSFEHKDTFQIPFFRHSKLSRRGSLFASLLAGANVKNIKSNNIAIARAWLNTALERVGSLSNAYRRVSELIKAKILERVNNQLQFTASFLQQYRQTYKALMR